MKRAALCLLVVACSPTQKITSEKVRSDLIGQIAPNGVCTWTFNDPNEIKSLVVEGVQAQNDIIIAEVQADLEDARSHRQFHILMHVSYRDIGGEQKIVAVAVDQLTPSCI